MRTRSSFILALGVLTAVAAPRPARADSGSDASSAMTLFEKGRDLRARGNCADAVPLFQKAYALYPLGVGSLRNIAVCQETLGHVASARAAWLELRHAVTGSTDPKYAGWTDDADREMARLAPKVASFTLDVAVADPAGEPATSGVPENVTVSLDGHALARDKIGTAIEHDPGSVVVRISGAGIVAADEQALLLGAGESRHVTLHVTLTPPPKAEVAAPAADAEPASGPHTSPLRTGAWIALGVGIVGVAGATASLVVRQTSLASLQSSCPQYTSGQCATTNEPAAQSDVDRGRIASATFTVLGVAGIVGAVASVTLFTLSGPSSSTAVLLTPTGLAAVGTF